MRYVSDEKRERRNKIILSVVIVAIMVLSSFGFMLDYAGNSGQSERAQSDYGTLTFKVTGQTVIAKVQGQNLQFGYFPSSLTGLNASAGVAEAMRQPVIYITSDASDPYASAIDEMLLRFTDYLPLLTQGSVIPAYTNVTSYSRPGVTCGNASAAVPVLYMKYGADTAITIEDNCIVAEGRTPSEIVAVADKLLFVTMGVRDV